jgi:cell division protein FtsB
MENEPRISRNVHVPVYRLGNTYCQSCGAWLHGGLPTENSAFTNVSRNKGEAPAETEYDSLKAQKDALVRREYENLRAERDELELTNNLIMDASRRAVAEWRKQDPEGRKRKLPDLKEHFIWAFNELSQLRAENERLKAEIQLITAPVEAGGGYAAKLLADKERLETALSRFVSDFESDFVLDGEIVDEPEKSWSVLPELYKIALEAMNHD